MEVATTRDPVTVLSVKGDIGSYTFTQLIEKAEAVIKQGHANLVLDLHDVNYISSGGLVALQTIAGKANAGGGKMVLCGLTRRVQQVVEISGFNQVLTIFPDAAAARSSFGKN